MTALPSGTGENMHGSTSTATMNAYLVDPRQSGGMLRQIVRPIPRPATGEVLVQVGAASLNYRDLLVARGFYGASQNAVIPLSDGAGTVVAAGPGVTPGMVGQRVAGAFFPDWRNGPVTAAARARSLGAHVDGMLADYVCLPAHAAIAVPSHLSDLEAATLPCAGLTGWHAVTHAAQLRPGMTLVLQGAGGVSVMALQFAKLMGLRVIHTASTPQKAEALRQLCADHVFCAPRGTEWASQVIELTDGLGADGVIDIGGPGSLEQSVRAVKVGGTIVSVGFAGEGPGIDTRQIVGRAIRMTGITVGSCAMFAEMNCAIGHAVLRPVIHRVFPMHEASAAFDFLERGDHVGKIVIDIAAGRDRSGPAEPDMTGSKTP